MLSLVCTGTRQSERETSQRRGWDVRPSGGLTDLEDAVGEDIDEAIDESVSDLIEPTELHKRE